jgi:DNA-binding NarL/FixJ family response regulator
MQSAPDIAVVLADLPGPSRAALAGLIDTAPGLRLAAQVSTSAELDAAVIDQRPDVILLDDRLLRDGTLRASQFDPAVVITGVDDDPAYAQRARRTGAVAWVAKEQSDEMLEALRAAGRTATSLAA